MYQLFTSYPTLIIVVILGISLLILSKAADLFVDNSVKLSELLGLPEIIIGATVVSLGTTLPELSTSVVSSLQGNGGFAMGNAVGSVITNTSLILGMGALFGPLPVDKKSTSKISIFIGCTLLLLLSSLPIHKVEGTGRIPQWIGYLFLILIPLYTIFLIKEERKTKEISDTEVEHIHAPENDSRLLLVILLVGSAAVIAISASALVASAELLAERVGIPDLIISSTLVAFGTSVPELSTCIAATKSKHGGLAIGNIIGSNILNILFVIGISAVLTKGGLIVQKEFYQIHFPPMLIILAFFGFFAYNMKIDEITRKEGILLILLYTAYLGVNVMTTL